MFSFNIDIRPTILGFRPTYNGDWLSIPVKLLSQQQKYLGGEAVIGINMCNERHINMLQSQYRVFHKLPSKFEFQRCVCGGGGSYYTYFYTEIYDKSIPFYIKKNKNIFILS